MHHCQKSIDSKWEGLFWILETIPLTSFIVLCLVTQPCPTVWTPWTVAPRLLCPWRFPRQEYWSRLPCSPPGNLPNPGIKPRPPTLQADSLPSEPPWKHKNTRVGILSNFQGIFLTQESNQGLLHFRWILYQLSYQGSPHWPVCLYICQ